MSQPVSRALRQEADKVQSASDLPDLEMWASGESIQCIKLSSIKLVKLAGN